MNIKGNILYGLGTMAIIAICVWFYDGYVYPRLPESLVIPTSYLPGNYREIDSMAIYNGDIEESRCFYYMFPRAYNIGYELIMANRYKDADSHYYFLEDLLYLTSKRMGNYSFQGLNASLEKMDDSLRIIALRHLSHSDSFDRQKGDDTVKLGNFATLYDSIYIREHKGTKGGEDE